MGGRECTSEGVCKSVRMPALEHRFLHDVKDTYKVEALPPPSCSEAQWDESGAEAPHSKGPHGKCDAVRLRIQSRMYAR